MNAPGKYWQGKVRSCIPSVPSVKAFRPGGSQELTTPFSLARGWQRLWDLLSQGLYASRNGAEAEKSGASKMWMSCVTVPNACPDISVCISFHLSLSLWRIYFYKGMSIQCVTLYFLPLSLTKSGSSHSHTFSKAGIWLQSLACKWIRHATCSFSSDPWSCVLACHCWSRVTEIWDTVSAGFDTSCLIVF